MSTVIPAGLTVQITKLHMFHPSNIGVGYVRQGRIQRDVRTGSPMSLKGYDSTRVDEVNQITNSRYVVRTVASLYLVEMI